MAHPLACLRRAMPVLLAAARHVTLGYLTTRNPRTMSRKEPSVPCPHGVTAAGPSSDGTTPVAMACGYSACGGSRSRAMWFSSVSKASSSPTICP